MELTGQCKIDFEKWLCKDVDLPLVAKETKKKVIKDVSLTFSLYSFSMQYGVYVDFFDSVGIIITISKINYLIHTGKSIKGIINKKPLSSRLEVRKSAISKANEIYNTK